MSSNGYPKFPQGKFTHFHKNLAVVDYYAKAAEAAALLEKTTRQYEAVLDEYGKSNAAMYELLSSRLVAWTTAGPTTAIDPDAKLKAMAHAFDVLRHATHQTCDAQGAKREIREVLMTILPLFCTLDKAGMDAASEPFMKESSLLRLAKSKSSGAKGAAKGKYNEAIKVYGGIYVDPYRLDHMPFESRAPQAFVEATEFADTWKYRARLFMAPVTIGGTAIATLPAAGKKLWMAAYNKLGLNELKHTDFYTPYRSQESSVVPA